MSEDDRRAQKQAASLLTPSQGSYMTVARQEPTKLPVAVRELAERLGVREDISPFSVALRQHGIMRNRPTSRWMRFRAMQTIGLHHSEFEWRAFTGPLGLITVVDALKNGEADLEVRLLRRMRIATVRGGASASIA